MADELSRGGGVRTSRTYREMWPSDPESIRHGIEDTRERLSHTVDEIGDRLNPEHLKAQVKQNIRDATIGRAETMARHAAERVHETRTGMMDTIRDNPIPSAMVGIGLGWLMWNGRREGLEHRTRTFRGGWYLGDEGTAREELEAGPVERIRDRASHLSERAGEVADRAEEVMTSAADRTQRTLSTTADRAQEMAGNLADRARYRADRVEDRLQERVDENPLAMGAAAVAIGLAAGLSAPSTRGESRLMGRARDRVIDRVRGMARETEERAQHEIERTGSRMETAPRTPIGEETRGMGGSTNLPL